MYIIFIFTFLWLSIICKYASLSDCIMSQENSYVNLNNNIRPKGSKTNKVIANTPVTSSVIAHTNKTIIPNYVTMSIYSPNYVNLTTYLRYRNRKKTIIFKPKPRAGVANNLRSIRGLMMIAMANNANFCMLDGSAAGMNFSQAYSRSNVTAGVLPGLVFHSQQLKTE